MVRHGITAVPAACYLEAAGGEDGDDRGETRSARALRLAAAHHPEGAVLVVGCAPTALLEVVRLARAGRLRPALVVGLPVGFVGAAEAKAALRASGLPAVSNVGEKGGSAVAAAAVNALARFAAAPASRGDRP
jgi:precorrin-8X/cobalt-precorrin-8 methylmutase